MTGHRLFFGLLLLATSWGCGNPCDHPEQQCTGLDGYLTYYNGKLDPASMCGVPVSGGGLHFHWDLPEGTCNCDVDDSGFAASAKWTNCRFSTDDASNPSGPSGPGGGTTGTAGTTSSTSTTGGGT